MLDKLNSYYQSSVLESRDDFFSWVLAAKTAYMGGHLLDFGVADAFTAPPAQLVAALQHASLGLPEHGYVYGHAAFEAACLAMALNGVQAEAAGSLAVLPTAGAKGALNVIAQAFINPGDVVLTTIPCYPIFKTQAERLGAEVHALPLLAENDYLPDLAAIPVALLARAKILAVNYPNNPTGKVLTQAEANTLLSFCVKHDLLLLNDAAYQSLTFDLARTGNLFHHPAAVSHCIEVHSLSKALQIPGWRLGFILCAKPLLGPLKKLAMMQNSGQPKFLQDAAAAVLEEGGYRRALNELVQRRLLRLTTLLRVHGFTAECPNGTFFLYVAAPVGMRDGVRFANAQDCAAHLVRELGVIVIPWQVAGRGFLRFSVAFAEPDEDGVFELLAQRLASFPFEFEAALVSCP